jgi:hypothetical protein
MPRLLIAFLCVLLPLIAGCSSSIRNTPSLPLPRPLGQQPEDAIGPSILDGGSTPRPAAGVENTAPTGAIITLDQTIRLVHYSLWFTFARERVRIAYIILSIFNPHFSQDIGASGLRTGRSCLVRTT